MGPTNVVGRLSIVLATFACCTLYGVVRFLPALIRSSCTPLPPPTPGPDFETFSTLLRSLTPDPSAPPPTALLIRDLNQSALKGIAPTTIVGCVGCRCDLCWLLGLNNVGEFSPVESAIYQYILRGKCGQQEQLVVDVGGNIGYFALLAAAYGCRVVAFEPQEQPRAMMKLSLSLNPHGENVQVYPYAIGSAEGTGHVQDGGVWGRSGVKRTTGAGAAAARHMLAGSSQLPVEFRVLGSIVKEDALLLKVDTEGYEAHVMEGSYEYLRSHTVANIVMEVKWQNTQPKRDLLRRVMKEARMDHAYSFMEDYYHRNFHQRGSMLQGWLQDVTQAVLEGNMNVSFWGEEFWLTKTALDIANM